MTDRASSSPGRCPRCDSHVPGERTLVEYERTDGESRRFAACPNCEAVIYPR